MTPLLQCVRGWLRFLQHTSGTVTRRESAIVWLPLPSVAIPLTSIAHRVLCVLLSSWPKSTEGYRLMVVRP